MKLLFLLLFTTHAFAHLDFTLPYPTEAEPYYSTLEHNLARLRAASDLPALQKEGHHLAQLYLRFRHYQQAIWTLRQTGNEVEAELYQQDLMDHISQAPLLNEVTNRDGGVSQHRRFRVEGDVILVCKEERRQGEVPDIRFEGVAFLLDRLLGLNLVPTTVFRQIEGKLNSVQVFIFHASRSNRDQRSSLQPHGTKIHVLDMIIGNWDRHEANWLLRTGSFPVALDHSHASPSRRIDNLLSMRADKTELKELATTLENTPDKNVEEVLSPILKTDEIQSILLNIQRVKDWLIQNGYPIAPVPVLAKPLVVNPSPPKVVSIGVPLEKIEQRLKTARRSESDQDREVASLQVIAWMEQIETQELILKELIASKRLAHFIEDNRIRIPLPFLIAYQQALTQFPNPESAHLRTKGLCEQIIQQGGVK